MDGAGVQVYKQKLKHVLAEHHGAISVLKTDGIASTSLIQNQHTESEVALQGEKHGLQADLREKKLHNENCIKELKLVSLVFIFKTFSCFISTAMPHVCLIPNRNTRWS